MLHPYLPSNPEPGSRVLRLNLMLPRLPHLWIRRAVVHLRLHVHRQLPCGGGLLLDPQVRIRLLRHLPLLPLRRHRHAPLPSSLHLRLLRKLLPSVHPLLRKLWGLKPHLPHLPYHRASRR